MISHSFFYYLASHYWLGMTDVVNGDWRWIYDQTAPNFKFWYPGYPRSASTSTSKTYNCVYMAYHLGGKWTDYTCNYSSPYICESNFCKFII